MRRDLRRRVAEQTLTIFEREVCSSQPILERVLEVMYPNGAKSRRAR